jgi:hypothetical protein
MSQTEKVVQSSQPISANLLLFVIFLIPSSKWAPLTNTSIFKVFRNMLVFSFVYMYKLKKLPFFLLLPTFFQFIFRPWEFHEAWVILACISCWLVKFCNPNLHRKSIFFTCQETVESSVSLDLCFMCVGKRHARIQAPFYFIWQI